MFASKVLLIISIYFFYRFTSYFMEFVQNGFPSWDDKFNMGNATYSLFFAPYGSLIGIILVGFLFFISAKNLYNYYLSNEYGKAEIINIQPSMNGDPKSPIDITVVLNGIEVTYDFTVDHYQEIYSIGDKIPVKFKKGYEKNSVLDEATLDKQYRQHINIMSGKN